MNSARIKNLLQDRSTPAEVALVLPSISNGLSAIDNTHASLNYYSPDLAAQVPLGENAGFWYKVSLLFTPLLLAFGWVDFFKAVSRYLTAADKKWALLNVVFRFVVATGTTLAVAFMLTSLAYVVPCILAAILGMNIMIGLYSTYQSLKLAYQEPSQRWQHLKMAGEHFLGIALNALAMAFNIILFQSASFLLEGIKRFSASLFDVLAHLEDLRALLSGPVSKSLSLIKSVGLAWLAVLGLKLLISAWRINQQTWKMLRGQAQEKSNLPYDMEVWQDIKNIFSAMGKSDVAPGIKLILGLTLPFYFTAALLYAVVFRPVAALVLGLPQLVLSGILYFATDKNQIKEERAVQLEEDMVSKIDFTKPNYRTAKKDIQSASDQRDAIPSPSAIKTKNLDFNPQCSSRLHSRRLVPPMASQNEDETLCLSGKYSP